MFLQSEEEYPQFFTSLMLWFSFALLCFALLRSFLFNYASLNRSLFLFRRLDTIDGTALAGEDYIKLSQEFSMEAGQQEKRITIHVIDDNQWEPDETFFVKLSLPDGQDNVAKLGSKTIALVTIINDDGEFIFLFSH